MHADGLDDEVASLSTIPGRHHILIGRIYANLDVDIAVGFGTQKHNGSSCVNARTANQESLGIVHMRPKKLEGTVVAEGWGERDGAGGGGVAGSEASIGRKNAFGFASAKTTTRQMMMMRNRAGSFMRHLRWVGIYHLGT